MHGERIIWFVIGIWCCLLAKLNDKVFSRRSDSRFSRHVCCATSNFCFFLVKPSLGLSFAIIILHFCIQSSKNSINNKIRFQTKVLSRQLFITILFLSSSITRLRSWMNEWKTSLSLIQYLPSNTHSENREKCLNNICFRLESI